MAEKTEDTAVATNSNTSPASFKTRIEECRKRRRVLLKDWRINVDYRRGKVTQTDDDDTRPPIPIDWANTKAKGAQLFSQMPSVVAVGEGPYKIAAPVYAKQV